MLRLIQINLGFNRRGLENCIKLELNRLARTSLTLRSLNVEVAFNPPTAALQQHCHLACQRMVAPLRINNNNN